MFLEIVQPQLFTDRRGNPFDSSTSLTARFSAIFRDFPNTGPPAARFSANFRDFPNTARPTGGKGYPSAGVAGAGRPDSTWWDARAMGEVDDS